MEHTCSVFLNKEVQIYPSDSYRKFGIVKGVDNNGILFLITKTEDAKSYPVGKLVFISYSSNLKILEV